MVYKLKPVNGRPRLGGHLLASAGVAGLVAVSLVSPAQAADGLLPYIDTEGVLQEHTGGYTLMQNSDPTALNGWYLCEGPTNVGPLTVTGTAHLVLGDDCVLTAEGTFDHTPGIRLSTGNHLSIYSQSTGDQQGRLTAIGSTQGGGLADGAGIGTSKSEEEFGNLTVAGGTVEATGAGGNAAGIGTSFRGTRGSVTVTGGTVHAQGGTYAAGIGGGRQGAMGSVLITGGTVEARGGSVGIGASGTFYGTGSVTIAGDASVTAIGGWSKPGLGTDSHSPGQYDPVTVTVATTGVVTSGPRGGTAPSIGYGQTATAWLVTTEVTGDGALLPRELTSLPASATQGTFSIPVGAEESLTFDAQPGPGLETLLLTLDGERLTDLDSYTLSDAQSNHTLAAIFGVIQTVSAASIDLDAPEFGEPLASTATTNDTDYTVTSLEWNPAHTTGAEATAYTATVVLTPEPGYVFDGSTAATVNGNAATVALEDDGTLTVTYEFPTTSIGVDSVALDIDVPVYAEELATAATTSDAGYTVGALSWTPNHMTGRSDTEYTASVTLTPADNHVFTDTTTATVNNLAVQDDDVTLGSDGSLTVRYTFSATDTAIWSMIIDIVDPVFGEPFTTEATTSDSRFSLGEVTWLTDDEIAASDTAYTAQVVLTPNDGYAFHHSPRVDIRVVTNPAEAVLNDDGSLTVTHTSYRTNTWVPEIDLDIDVPIFSEELGTAHIDDGSVAGLRDFEWTPDHSVAQSGVTYTATGRILAAEGYVFNDETTVTINGNSVAVERERPGEFAFEYIFPATDSWIENADIQIEAPELGVVPTDSATTSDTRFSTGPVTWAPGDGVAAPATSYTATVVITPNAGYVFNDSTTASINGDTATATLEPDGTLIVVYEFPATDRNTVDITVADFDTEFTYGDEPFLVSANAAASPIGDPDWVAPMSLFSAFTTTSQTVPVAFSSSDPTVATVLDHGDGTATVTILRAGTFTLAVTTEQTDTLHASRADTGITIAEATPTLTLTSGIDSVSATVSGPGATPTGTVTFYVDGQPWQSDVPLVDGIATVELDGLTPGARSITATFNGDAGYYTTAAQNAVLSITVAAPEQPATDTNGTQTGDDDTLPVTGGTMHYALIATAIALVFLGAMLALIRQRRMHDTDLA